MDKLTSDVMIELHVPDFEKTKNFYKGLGFETVWERKPTLEKSGYLVIKRGGSILNFWCGDNRVYKQQYFKKFPSDTPRGYATEIIIPVDDIKNFYKNIFKLYEKHIVFELQEKYGHCEFRIVDPFGFYLRFAERYDWVNK